MSVKIVKCKPLDRNLILSHGDELFLEEGKARALADIGKVSYEGYEPLARVLKTETRTAPGVTAPSRRTTDARPPAPGSYLKRDAWAPSHHGHILKRILWVQDRSKLGGAELSNDTVVAVGERLGFDIIGVCPGYFPGHLFATANCAILNNLFQFSGEQLRRLLALCFEDRLPFIKYDHDYRELGRLNIARSLFQRARLAVFISPRHHAQFVEALGPVTSHVILPLAVDVDTFTPGKADRPENSALIPTPQKCGADLRKFMETVGKDYAYTIVGNSHGLSIPSGVKASGAPEQSQEGMRDLYRRHHFVVHLPEKPWAGERVVLEASLCDATVVMNDNVGHKSWERFPSRTDIALAPYQFWKAVDSCI